MTKILLKTDSLAFSLLGAAHAITQVRAGKALPQALSLTFHETNAPPQARGAMQDIAYRAMRGLGRVDALLALLTDKTPTPALLHGLICCALTLISDNEVTAEHAPYDAFTVVDQAVTAANADHTLMRAKGMVNAVLRRFLRERESLLSHVLQQPVAQWNYPIWWIKATKQAYPDTWQQILQYGNDTPPLTLRVNQRKTSVADYLHKLSEHHMNATQIGPHAVWLHKPVPVSQIPEFNTGWVSVQDAAAQLAVPLLDIHNGTRVLDACAAPGGKTGHILESADVELIALDSDPKRLIRIEENLQRLQLQAQLICGDATQTTWWNGDLFDRILADVPCTASGILRRHPDIRWLRREEDATQLATLSARILDNLWQMLRPDGKLLFVTCSLWPQESEMQAAAFATRNHAKRLTAPGQLLPTASAALNHDGLFYALFQKTAVS